ncbi:MAG: domain S-box-containing protein/diguanylate cyclase protein [Frankiales bacterium]|nr:domain S-box-containing protein/diguanylate cyclase protein [Frankiales bacterium]
MTEIAGTSGQREDVLAAMLRHERALVAAVASDGVFVPMPDSVRLPAERVMAAPTRWATMVDLVAAADALVVVAAWEQARAHGVAFSAVHSRSDPAVTLSLTFVDARDRHGVFLGALEALAVDDDAVAQPLETIAVSRTPRTATVHKNMLAVITDVDDRTTLMLGWSREQMIGARSSDFIHPDDQERAIACWMELLSQQNGQRVRLRHRRADGGWVWVEMENQYRPADDPADAVVVTQMSDISDEMAAHEAVLQRERLLRRVAESLPVGILQLSTDRSIVFANSRLASILGTDDVRGVPDLLSAVTEPDRPALTAALEGALHGDVDAELEIGIVRRSGEARICSISLVSLGDREGTPGALLSLTDVTDSARMRQELTAKATYDVLTGCHNRASTLAFVEQALQDPDGGPTAVIFVDLDRLKPVNDMLGHDAGDELLAVAARRITGVLRHDDIVGRIGGDEFLVVCRGLASPDEALGMGHRVRDALVAPAVLTAGPVDVSGSIGVACARPGIDVAALIKLADGAMYVSKHEGHGRPVLADA